MSLDHFDRVSDFGQCLPPHVICELEDEATFHKNRIFEMLQDIDRLATDIGLCMFFMRCVSTLEELNYESYVTFKDRRYIAQGLWRLVRVNVYGTITFHSSQTRACNSPCLMQFTHPMLSVSMKARVIELLASVLSGIKARHLPLAWMKTDARYVEPPVPCMSI
jgi:hypothetical protein